MIEINKQYKVFLNDESFDYNVKLINYGCSVEDVAAAAPAASRSACSFASSSLCRALSASVPTVI
jgi:hypothetical protein